MKSNLGLQRAKSVTDIMNMNIPSFDFDGEWQDAFGYPESKGVWIIYGDSGNGKTSFTFQLAKYLTRFDKVIYNSLEEGYSLNIQNTMKFLNMQDVNNKFLFLNNESISDLTIRLELKRSPRIVIIDSAQYTDLNNRTFIKFRTKFKDKLIIFTSHEKNNEPEGALARKILYDAKLKIRVEGFKAFSRGRTYGKKGSFIIYHEKALEYYGDNL
jgi:KaiC/GvpD/RAD55 family RecA-like ATPase